MNIYEVIRKLINKAVDARLIEKEDEVYVSNRIIALLGIEEMKAAETAGEVNNEDIPELLEKIVEYGCEKGVIEDIFDEREILSSSIMDCFIDRPSVINKHFYERYKENPERATEYFYGLSKSSNYIQSKRIGKNINYKASTEYGELDITINLSKPEKNPKDIIKEGKLKSTNYPKCLLCIENEGYAGRIGHPARSNHRMIRIDLLKEQWYLQYSPYSYYNEHCIVLSKEHRDMKIDRQSFSRLLAFVELFPHYFLGSNADLPIVGGSILSHDHYQGGRYEFVMAKAEEEYKFKIDRFPEVQCAVIKWPMSVIRLKSANIASLVDTAEHILNSWRRYSDDSVDIYAYTKEVPHNTITPIARKKNNFFELDLVLRNNRTSKDHPLGIFHPREDVHHIKKENIGLIEVMGLAVLPARLKTELKDVGEYLLGHKDNIAEYHKNWAEELKERYREKLNSDNLEEIIRKETAAKFKRVLEDAAVFKRDERGRKAFKRFIESLN
ncbi:UDP-glucose--hexose-1-phosphate uridylyltransferase [Clostridium sp. CX1]|uniref:UDP-glucose--hexose-1-phosphate uridylyltransferase n=1 Tax=Clostridium sp. CX1 TaxID=2978346 RepID=UPI0021C1EB6C|nr:UDP-glucose--hexose-1-phosphate uridylyltransferase [Clostridium sp. CX1]MCT8975151.1 UDP-glucose--hexose-1-phosphate uridylyltransferase [Clostridium sp. CX1]